jgi:hypothetical protein
LNKNAQEKTPHQVMARLPPKPAFLFASTQILLAAFVVMLDHWHAVLATSDGMTISREVEDSASMD